MLFICTGGRIYRRPYLRLAVYTAPADTEMLSEIHPGVPRKMYLPGFPQGTGGLTVRMGSLRTRAGADPQRVEQALGGVPGSPARPPGYPIPEVSHARAAPACATAV